MKRTDARHLHRLCGWLKGLPQALEPVFPKAQVQLCIVHLVRNSLNHVSWKERKAVPGMDLKPIYGAATSDDGWQCREAFAGNGMADIRASARLNRFAILYEDRLPRGLA